jgi:hypothetical protein
LSVVPEAHYAGRGFVILDGTVNGKGGQFDVRRK